MEDNGIVNKESVESLIALTDVIQKADPDGKVVTYNLDMQEHIVNLAKNTEGISSQNIENLKNINNSIRERRQGMVIDFAAYSKDELSFVFPPKVCSELYEILKNIDKAQVLKIPAVHLNAIRNGQDFDNPVKIDWEKPLIEQKFEEGTLQFLNWACYRFWLENDAEREVWSRRFSNANLIEQKETIFEKIKKLL